MIIWGKFRATQTPPPESFLLCPLNNFQCTVLFALTSLVTIISCYTMDIQWTVLAAKCTLLFNSVK